MNETNKIDTKHENTRLCIESLNYFCVIQVIVFAPVGNSPEAWESQNAVFVTEKFNKWANRI